MEILNTPIKPIESQTIGTTTEPLIASKYVPEKRTRGGIAKRKELKPGFKDKKTNLSIPGFKEVVSAAKIDRMPYSPFSGDLVQAVLNVFNFLGGEQFLADWAKDNPTIFVTHILSKCLPKDVNIRKQSQSDNKITITSQILGMLTTEQLQEIERMTIEHIAHNNVRKENECTTSNNSPTEAAMTEGSNGSS